MGADVVAQLVQDGAQTLIGAMVTDTWAQVRDLVAKLLGRGDRAAEEAEERPWRTSGTPLGRPAGIPCRDGA